MTAIRFAQSKGADRTATKTQGMAAVGEIPARDIEFEEILRDAAEFQRMNIGCKLRGEAIS
jgi:hypothetical protein